MIYVIAPGDHTTGGPETLHQAAYLIASMGYQVQMYYVDPHTTKVPDAYKKYQTKAAVRIVDSSSNVLIVPEAHSWVLSKYHKIKKCIWWLSVDNYYVDSMEKVVNTCLQKYHLPTVLYPAVWFWKVAIKRYHPYHYHFEDNGELFHAYNCEYARQYIMEHNVLDERTIYLCGPLNSTFFENAKKMGCNKQRENIVLYNPKKGAAFTQKLITAARKKDLQAQFIPIQRMSPQQIGELMSRAKVYIDFGEFPGPERIPREAVTMGCNIITCKNGAAANSIDVPIPDFMKLDDREENIPKNLGYFTGYAVQL